MRDLHRPERRRDRADVRARTPAPVRKSAHATRTIPTRISPRPTKRPTMSQVRSIDANTARAYAELVNRQITEKTTDEEH